MIDKRIQLTVLEENAGVFTDHSENTVDYLRDTVTLNMDAGDHLYVGFKKATNAVFAEISTPSTLGSSLALEAWDGAAWTAIDHRDESKGFSRRGFITWNRADVAETTVDGKSLCWVRLSFDNGCDAIVDGLNLIFSDDEALKREFPSVLDPRIATSGSHISQHVAAKTLMVQTLRNEGYITQGSDGAENLTQWDLLDVYEIREAATYLALSKIFFLLSDEVDDNWWTKHLEYSRLYSHTFNTAKLSIDSNNDGVADSDEVLAPRKSMRFSR